MSNLMLRFMAPDGFNYGEPFAMCDKGFKTEQQNWTDKGLIYEKMGRTDWPCNNHENHTEVNDLPKNSPDDPQRPSEASKASLRQQTFMFLLGEYERGALSAKGFWGNVQSQIFVAQQTVLLEDIRKNGTYLKKDSGFAPGLWLKVDIIDEALSKLKKGSMNNHPKGSDMADKGRMDSSECANPPQELIAILNTYHDQSNYDPGNQRSHLNKALTDLQDLFCVSDQCPNSATHNGLCYPHSLSTHPPKMNWEVS